MKSKLVWHKTLIAVVLLYLSIPLLATFLYSISTDWYRTVLPEGYTGKWYVELVSDPRFIDALGRTLFVCVVTIVISLVVMVITVFTVTVYLPRLERVLQGIAMLPYAVPPVVAAVGLITIYSQGPFALSGSVWLVIGAYFVAILPYMYQGIRNSMRTVDAITLLDAAELLGASKLKGFWLVVFPNILPGVLVATLLSFSILFGEFVLANLLIGGHYEMIQVYLVRRMEENGHLASSIVVCYFVFISMISAVVLRLGRSAKEGRT
ncbi:MAG TPA: ABC transporter permease subunit [Candidatus Bathyarchaeia archaeon]|nr:ABC transporter permease subunit [Candidatus Bathyarchaeia archaeon]